MKKDGTSNDGLPALAGVATRLLFFTGKGGVGKTSLACATAVLLADRGSRVLLVSTDPASNLDEVLGQKIREEPTPLRAVPGLAALNIDPLAAAAAYRERLIGPQRGILPETVLRRMEESLSGACTTEIAAFDEFARLLGEPKATEDYDHVIFDTAPTGHTLRLMNLPSAWTDFFETNTTGASCLGPLAGLQKQRATYENAMAALADAGLTTLVLVSRPQRAALEEAERTSRELVSLGITNQRLVINGVFRGASGDSLARALEQRQSEALAQASDFRQSWPTLEVPLHRHNQLGIAALRVLAGAPSAETGEESRTVPACSRRLESLRALVDDLEAPGRGLIMTMGKGGVGKTTLAAAIAAELARRGHRVHLSTTDPAAHVLAAVGQMDGLEVGRLDPGEETRAYSELVMATAGRGLDEAGRALLAEDLRSPCTEEIAIFRAFARVVARGLDGFVVLDTAPTGHTLLLLDATEAYHREIGRQASDLPEEVAALLPRLRDPLFTRVLIVTLPEATPVHEAQDLQKDLYRAGLRPFAWIVNQSLAGAETGHPLLLDRAAAEQPYLDEVLALAPRTVLVPWVEHEPAGADNLQQLFRPEVARGQSAT